MLVHEVSSRQQLLKVIHSYIDKHSTQQSTPHYITSTYNCVTVMTSGREREGGEAAANLTL